MGRLLFHSRLILLALYGLKTLPGTHAQLSDSPRGRDSERITAQHSVNILKLGLLEINNWSLVIRLFFKLLHITFSTMQSPKQADTQQLIQYGLCYSSSHGVFRILIRDSAGKTAAGIY